ncbi:MAG: YCF48-related protein [Candidatus Kapabacteria bacterium]|nr:YCF48-related protein [Candidatus Kapabacteria bacterium]
MKTKILFVFFCFAMFTYSSQAQVWGNQPIPDFTSVHFVDSLTGWAGGEGNPIFKTTDGGKSWSPQIGKVKSRNELGYSGIKFIDSNNGFICGHNKGDSSKHAFLLKTSDGGINWDTNFVLSNSSFDNEFSAFSYVNSQIAYVVGYKKSILKADSATFYKPLLYKTTNGGKNWVNITINLGISNCTFNDMKFVDANKGWIVGQNDSLNSRLILKTEDGGLTWARQLDEKKAFGIGYMHQISLIDSLNLFATGTDNRNRELLMNTTDGGANWSSNGNFPFKLTELQGLYFTDNLNGILCGEVSVGRSEDNFQIIIKTSDGGVTWDSVYSIKNQLTHNDNIGNYYVVKTFKLYEASFVNANKGFLVGKYGNVLTTSNGGKDWVDLIDIKPKSDMSYVTFVDSINGWSLGSNLNTTSPYWSKIYNSNDGGLTWKKQFDDSSYNINKIVFFDSKNGFAVGDKVDSVGRTLSSAAFKTSNGGSNWILHSDSLINSKYSFLSNVFYLDISNVWITGGTHYLLTKDTVAPRPFICKSSDGGNSWRLDTIGMSNIQHYIYGIFFKDIQNGWAYGGFEKISTSINPRLSGNIIYKTTNGGASWKICYIKDTTAVGVVRSLIMVDSLNGFAVGRDYYSLLLYTQDAGNTWNKAYGAFANFPEFSNITFVDRLTGWINGNSANGKFSTYHTEDGGESWYLQENISETNNISFVDSKHGWSASPDGTISKYRSLGIKTLAPAFTTYCPDDDIIIPFSFDTKLNFYFLFDAEISDKNGSFLYSRPIGSSYDYQSGVINAKIPKNLTPGYYKIRLMYSDNDVTINIRSAPSPLLSGPQTVCINSIATYKTKYNPDNDVKWNITGGVIIGQDNLDSVRVKWSKLGNGKIEVSEAEKGQFCYGKDALVVKVKASGVNPDLNVTGSKLVCANDSLIQEYTNDDLDIENNWSVSGGTIIGSNKGKSVKVQWISGQRDTIFLDQKILSGGCVNSIAMEILVDTTAFPKVSITGEDFTCLNQTKKYSVPNYPNLKVKWTIEYATINGSSTDDSISVTFPYEGIYSLHLTYTNKFGCTNTLTKTIDVNLLGASIKGPDVVCQDSSITRYYAKYKGMTNKWSFQYAGRGKIIGRDDLDSVDVIWNPKYVSYLVLNLDQISKDGCGVKIQLNVYAKYPTIYTHIPLLKADPREYKDKMFSIPIILDSTQCNAILEKTDSVQIIISFNKSFFLPIKSNTLSYDDKGDMRTIFVTLPVSSNKLNDTITKIDGWLLLGDKLSSDIIINGIFIKDKTLSTINIDGKIELTGVSMAGGPRLLTNKSLTLMNLYPVPAQDNLNIEIDSQIEQNATILIYNILGEKVFEKVMTFKEGKSIENIKFDNNNTNGIYNLIIKSENCLTDKTFIISGK